MFKKGQSGNPGGMPKENAEIKAMCRNIGPAVIERLIDFALNGKPEYAIPAAKELLCRGFGKAESYNYVHVTGTAAAVEHMSDKEIKEKLKLVVNNG